MDLRQYHNSEDNKVLAYVVKDNNILGYLFKIGEFFHLGILQASILRGAVCNPYAGPLVILQSEGASMRKATISDFAEFRVCSDGYSLSL